MQHLVPKHTARTLLSAIDRLSFSSRGEGFHAWSESEVAQFQARHPIDSKAGVALALLLHTGQRRGDIVKLGWQHVHDDTITVRQEKTDEPLTIAMHPELLRALQAAPRTNLNFLLTEFGKPFTAAGFGGWFRERCDEANLPQCSAHGLRKLAATRIADAGGSNQHIKSRTGHRSDSALAPYIRGANQARLSRQALDVQSRAEREQKLSSTPTLLDKKRAK